MEAVKHSLGNIGTKLILYPISFITSIIIARYLGPEDRGIYSYLLLLITFLLPITSFGFGSGIIYFISTKKYTPQQAILPILSISSLLGAFLALMVLILWKFSLLGKSGQLINYSQIIFVSFSIFLTSIIFFITRLLIGNSKFPEINKYEFLKGILTPLLLILFVYFFGLRVTGASFSIFLLSLFTLGYLVYVTLKLYRPIYTINLAFIRDSFFYGLKGWLGDIAVKANVRLDQIILGAIISAKSLGVYGVAVLLSELIWIIPDAVGPVLYTKIAGLNNAKKQIETAKKVHSTLFLITLVISIALTLMTFFVIIPYFYGKEYEAAIFPFLILVPGTIGMVSTKVISKLLTATGHIGKTSIVQIISSVISIILYLLFIPLIGIKGAAIASSTGYISGMLISIYYYKKHFKQKVFDLFIPNISEILRNIITIRKLLFK